MMPKICLIYNYAHHYRKSIFSLLDSELGCDFVFGNKYLDVKKMDYTLFHHKVTEVKNIKVGPFLYQRNVLKLIFQGYDKFIVLGEPMNLSTWGILFLAKFFRKEVYLWTHGWYGREGFLKKIIKKVFYKLSSGILLYGNYAKKLMIENGFNKNSLFVIYNSLDYDKQLLVREKLKKVSIYKDHFGNLYPVLLFVGRLTSVKRLDMLLDVVRMSIYNGRPLNLILIGQGEKQNELESMTRQYGIDSHVWFYGPSYDEIELSSLIYNADICVSPGNVGLTAIHSLVYGCPVITHDNYREQMPEFEAIKIGITGDFFHQNDLQSLYKVIQKWLDNHKDRNEIRDNAYKEIDLNWNPYNQLRIIKKALNLE